MKVVCPKCGSDQLSAHQKGFSGGKAVAGAVLTGGIGLLAGTIGSKKVLCTCLVCGNTFKAGEGKVIYEPGETPLKNEDRKIDMEKRKKINKIILISFGSIFLLIILIVLLTGG